MTKILHMVTHTYAAAATCSSISLSNGNSESSRSMGCAGTKAGKGVLREFSLPISSSKMDSMCWGRNGSHSLRARSRNSEALRGKKLCACVLLMRSRLRQQILNLAIHNAFVRWLLNYYALFSPNTLQDCYSDPVGKLSQKSCALIFAASHWEWWRARLATEISLILQKIWQAMGHRKKYSNRTTEHTTKFSNVGLFFFCTSNGIFLTATVSCRIRFVMWYFLVVQVI